MNELDRRFHQVFPLVTSERFLKSQGIGNEIACYIFDYDAEDELKVREHLGMVLRRIDKECGHLNVLHLSLLDVVVDYLKGRGLYDKVLQREAKAGSEATLKALRGPLAAEKLRNFIASTWDLASYDLVLVSGVGSVWPMVRAHGLLNTLHTVIGGTPLVLFYPGRFDGTALRLFGRIASTSHGPASRAYYRAFTLVPRES